MSDKTWNRLERIATVIALLTVGITCVVFFEEPYEIKTSPLGITFLGVIFVCVAFGLFAHYREKQEELPLRRFGIQRVFW